MNPWATIFLAILVADSCDLYSLRIDTTSASRPTFVNIYLYISTDYRGERETLEKREGGPTRVSFWVNSTPRREAIYAPSSKILSKLVRKGGNDHPPRLCHGPKILAAQSHERWRYQALLWPGEFSTRILINKILGPSNRKTIFCNQKRMTKIFFNLFFRSFLIEFLLWGIFKFMQFQVILLSSKNSLIVRTFWKINSCPVSRFTSLINFIENGTNWYFTGNSVTIYRSK